MRYLTLLIVLLTACSAPDSTRPDDLIPPEQMATILTDVHLAEANTSRLNLSSGDSSNLVYKQLEQRVFKKLKVDTSAYTRSYVYYSSHPREMEVIYKRVVENLQAKTKPQRPTR